MLIARWKYWPVMASYAVAGQPLSNVVARCRYCGHDLGRGGWPREAGGKAIVESALLADWFKFDESANIWIPGKRTKQEWQTVRAGNSTAPSQHRRYDSSKMKPRHPRAVRDGRYLRREDLPPGNYPVGVVAKMELPRAPKWEVKLPVLARCIECRWLNEVQPLAVYWEAVLEITERSG